jgi:hypothetical protein
MRFKPTIRKRLQGAADARRRARRRTFVLQVPDNKADAVPCERLQKMKGQLSTEACPYFFRVASNEMRTSTSLPITPIS